MKTLIAYSTTLGCTEQCASKLKDDLGEGVEMVRISRPAEDTTCISMIPSLSEVPSMKAWYSDQSINFAKAIWTYYCRSRWVCLSVAWIPMPTKRSLLTGLSRTSWWNMHWPVVFSGESWISRRWTCFRRSWPERQPAFRRNRILIFRVFLQFARSNSRTGIRRQFQWSHRTHVMQVR